MNGSVLDIAEIMHTAGFDAEWIKNIKNDDVIMVVMLDSPNPVEMTVTRLEPHHSGSLCWIGILTTGAQLHCVQPGYNPCYKRRDEALPTPDTSELDPE